MTEYSKQFKIKVSKLIVEDGYSIREVTEYYHRFSYDLKASTVRNWVKTYQERGQEAFVGKGQFYPDTEKRLRLKRDYDFISRLYRKMKGIAEFTELPAKEEKC